MIHLPLLDTTELSLDQVVLPDLEEFGIRPGKRRLFKQFLVSNRCIVKAGETNWEIDSLFERFLCGPDRGHRLHLQFDLPQTLMLGTNWVSLGLDEIEQVGREGGKMSLEHRDHSVDRVLCIGLDAISQPASLINEIYRILKPDGQIWVQAKPRKTVTTARDTETLTYWCFTSRGLRLVLKDFEPLTRSADLNPCSMLQGEAFYHGKKTLIAEDVPPN